MKDSSPVSQLGNFVDRPWGVSEIGGTASLMEQAIRSVVPLRVTSDPWLSFVVVDDFTCNSLLSLWRRERHSSMRAAPFQCPFGTMHQISLDDLASNHTSLFAGVFKK